MVALQLVILTACRSGEVRGARWDEIEMDDATWSIPAARTKARRDHRVPLSAPALTVLRRMATIRRGDLVFCGHRSDRPLSDMTLTAVLRRMDLEYVPHGFRATFRTWAAECTNAPHEMCEAALAHAPTSKVVAAYQRGDLFDRRRALMDAWGQFVTGVR